MGRISAAHVAGLDLIDKLFFNQILVLCLFTEELVWLKDLDEDIERELTGKGVEGVQRQVVKHGVLCLMESELSESILLFNEAFPGKLPPLPADLPAERLQEAEHYKRRFFSAFVLAMLSKLHGCDQDAALDIAQVLLEKYAPAPATVRYRLVERMFAFNFIAGPIDCFTWLSKMDVLNSAKQSAILLESRHGPDFLPRLALLCELDMQRHHIRRTTGMGGTRGMPSIPQVSAIREPSPKTRKLMLQNFAKAMEVESTPELNNSFPVLGLHELEDPAAIGRFLSRVHAYALRVRVFQGSLASWTGMLCAGLVEVLDGIEDRKKPIFAADFNEGSQTERVADAMARRGYGITPRSIYERHRDFKETVLRAVTTYYRIQLGVDVAAPPDLNDATYEGLAPHIEMLQPAPRRGTGRRTRPGLSPAS